MAKISKEKQTALDWIKENIKMVSDFHQEIWHYAEPGLREYKSARAYVKVLTEQGFQVQEGTGGMPTAFLAEWGEGKPVLASYAEYDAVPGNCQAPVTYKKPRDGLHPYAAGHTDPHSALGTTTLAAILAVKKSMEEHGLKGKIKYFGEPAEKICISKPYHAAKGYYDDFDASVLYHPGNINSIPWETPCGAYWNVAYTFEAFEPEKWTSPAPRIGWYRGNPGAMDAVCLMHTTTKYTKECMHPRTAGWTVTEFIMTGGQSTTYPPLFSTIDYAFRSPTLEMQEQIHKFLRRNAKSVAEACGCKVTERIVTKTRVGLFNQTISELAWKNMQIVGPPVYNEKAKKVGREIQKNLGLEPMDEPFTELCQKLSTPQEFDAWGARKNLPSWVKHYSSDDYVEYSWYGPCTGIFRTAQATLKPVPGFQYPNWARLAMTGIRETIDPMIFTGAKIVAFTMIELLTQPSTLKKAQDEFKERTGGGIGGTKWVPPLLPPELEAPIDMRWPEYVKTDRGEEWCIPTPHTDQGTVL